MIRAEHLVKKFGDLEAVRDISFDVNEGEIFAFLGRTARARPLPSRC